MPIHRRDFMKLFGISVASLYLNRGCIPFVSTPEPTCYAPTAPPPTAIPANGSARERLRLYWQRFPELAEKSRADTENSLGQELIDGHSFVLDELVANGEISIAVASLVQEAYEAAVYHVWRSNAPITCYKPAFVNYAPAGAAVLVEQSQILNQLAEAGTIDPETLAKARAALEHDLAFYALTDEEVKALYDQLRRENDLGEPLPSFEALSLELTPEAKEATQFILDLLTGK